MIWFDGDALWFERFTKRSDDGSRWFSESPSRSCHSHNRDERLSQSVGRETRRSCRVRACASQVMLHSCRVPLRAWRMAFNSYWVARRSAQVSRTTTTVPRGASRTFALFCGVTTRLHCVPDEVDAVAELLNLVMLPHRSRSS